MSNVKSNLFNISKVFLISSSIIYSSFGADNIENPGETYRIGLNRLREGDINGGNARIGQAASRGHRDALIHLSRMCPEYEVRLIELSVNWNQATADQLFPEIGRQYFNEIQ